MKAMNTENTMRWENTDVTDRESYDYYVLMPVPLILTFSVLST